MSLGRFITTVTDPPVDLTYVRLVGGDGAVMVEVRMLLDADENEPMPANICARTFALYVVEARRSDRDHFHHTPVSPLGASAASGPSNDEVVDDISIL
jgi:hypothetical protein